MRGYWLKIALGALAIFAIGMGIVSVFEVGRRNVEAVVEGTGPITVPLAFVPLNVDGARLGTLRRVRVYRDSLQRPTRIEATISGADSAGLARLADCVLAIDSADVRGNVRPNHYRCLGAGDTAGADLVTFGELLIRDRTERFSLFAPRAQVEEVTSSFGPSVSASDSAAGDSLEREEARIEAIADSMAEAADSLHQVEMERIDSVRQSVFQRREGQ
ncbi:MAG: hypothetical protein ACM357_00905 [Gemmatimonadota bacterium]